MGLDSRSNGSRNFVSFRVPCASGIIGHPALKGPEGGISVLLRLEFGSEHVSCISAGIDLLRRSDWDKFFFLIYVLTCVGRLIILLCLGGG